MSKKLLFFLLILVGGVAFGQISVKIECDHPSYLRYETIRMRVTLINLSGNTLVFGGSQERENGQLLFDVTSYSGRFVHCMDTKAAPLDNLILAPNEKRVLFLRFNRLYDVQRADVYHVTAIVNHNRITTKYKSNTVSFEVREGFHEVEKVIGLPTSSSTDMIAQMRLTLIRFTNADTSIYCLRADDDNHIYGTFRLGPYLMGSQPPQMIVENGTTVHILLQIAPRLYCYSSFSVEDRKIIKRQQVYYTAWNGISPTLSRASGFIRVHNGVPAKPGTDYKIEDDGITFDGPEK